MTVPPAPPAEEVDGLYDLAPSEEDAKPKPRRAPAASAPAGASGVVDAVAAAPRRAGPSIAAIPYQRGLTQRERERGSSANTLDMARDVHVPVALLVVGLLAYLAYYIVRYDIGGTGIAAISLGLGMMTVVKAALMMGFAFAVAGPLGVSFGGIYTAALKLAAVAIFADGVTAWVEYGVDKMTGASGFFGGMISFPISLGVYWILLTYLFSMDPGDSWLVVILLAVFDYIVRFVLIMLLVTTVLRWGGAAAIPAMPVGGATAGVQLSEDQEMAVRIAELKDAQALVEAREFIDGGTRQAVLGQPTEDWYAAGARNVWFEVSRDINGKMSADGVIVEMPTDKEQRARCYEILRKYYENAGFGADPEDFTDDGRRYLEVMVR